MVFKVDKDSYRAHRRHCCSIPLSSVCSPKGVFHLLATYWKSRETRVLNPISGHFAVKHPHKWSKPGFLKRVSYFSDSLRGIFTPVRVVNRFLRALFVFCGVLGASLILTIAVRAADTPPNQDGAVISPLRVYTVMPGDTLAIIAERFGTTIHALMQDNSIQFPADIYPGQALAVRSGWEAATQRITLAWGDTLLDISRRTGVAWERLATANRLLQPAAPIPGFSLVVPDTRTIIITNRAQTISPIAAALTYRLPLWTVQRLNPYPIISGEQLVVPSANSYTMPVILPFPLREVSVSEQPLVRGATVHIALTTASQVTCTLQLLEQRVPCYEGSESADGDVHYTALLGLSPLLEPGKYTVTLSLLTETGDSLNLPLPVLVSAGRYDYERIDLPPDRQALLDPALSQAERNKIAALRTVRTLERFWSMPFSMPMLGSITSYYGSRRSYGYGFNSYHGGTDFRARVGTPVSAPAAGTVVLAEALVVRGNAVILDHGWGVMSGYWHLSRIEVEVDQVINRGDLIGAVGNTGLSTGPHLHWEMWVNGVSVSPLAWANADETPVLGE